MRIEDDDRRESTIRKIQDYQSRLDAEQNAAKDRDVQHGIERSRADEDLRRADQQGAEGVLANGKAREANDVRTGSELHDEAVKAAAVQEDRGRDWTSFRDDATGSVIPASVEQQKAEQQSSERREEEQRINVRDLLNRNAIQSGKINA